jgi:hypothetical protein
MPAALQRVGILRRQQRQAAQAIELRRDGIDVEQLRILAPVAQLQVLYDALDIENAAAPRLEVAPHVRLVRQLDLHTQADAVDLGPASSGSARSRICRRSAMNAAASRSPPAIGRALRRWRSHTWRCGRDAA